MRSRKLKGDCVAAALIGIIQAGEVQIKSINMKSRSSDLKSPFQKSSDSTSHTEKNCYNYLYFYIVELYREVCHVPIHTPNCKAYKQHDYLLKGS